MQTQRHEEAKSYSEAVFWRWDKRTQSSGRRMRRWGKSWRNWKLFSLFIKIQASQGESRVEVGVHYQGRETDHIKKTLSAEKVDRFYNLFQEWGKGPWGWPLIPAEVIEESTTDCTRRPQSSKVGCESAHLGIKLSFSKRNFLQKCPFLKIHKTMFANTQFTKVRV